MRERRDGFAARSLVTVFGLQAAIAWVVSLPIQAVAADPSPAALGALDWLGVAVAAIGIGFEATADLQLARFLGSDRAAGAVMDRGLWRYSRHPNYFGDTVFWWGIWLLALATGSGWWTLIGPALMTFLLLRVSGVALTERTIERRRPEYARYVERTSAFVPRRPRG
jgi:steroid 5-alpha reductase family enzyme